MRTKDRPKTQPGVLSLDLVLLGGMLFASGAVALLYEAAWQREFTLLFGSSAPATAAVLAAYFTGLGLGSFLLGRFVPRVADPLRLYAVLETAVGTGALFVGPILSWYAEFYPRFFSRFEGGGTAFLVAKGMLAFFAIVIPTAAMGGTLPVLAQLFDRRRARFGELAGWLYLTNTAGAAVGVAAFPLLLAALGMDDVIRVCVAINFAIASGALLLAKTNRFALAELKPDVSSAAPRRISSWLWVAFWSGFSIFALQVAWNRALAQVHENSIYSFSGIVAVFILAIVIGAEVARVLLNRGSEPGKALGVMWVIGGIATLIAPFLFVGMTELKYAPATAFWIPRELIGVVIVTVVLPIVFLATGFPLILQRAANTSERGTGELAGTILAANIAGCVAGAIAGGFLFPGALGLWRSIILIGVVSVAVGLLLACKSSRIGLRMAAAAIIVGGAGKFFDLPRTRVETASGEQLLGIEEGAHGVSAVVERSGSRRLKLNNHYVLGGTFATGDERLQAHIPLLLHNGVRQAVFLGYGTGITAGAAAFHPVDTALALELVPEVVDLAHRFFPHQERKQRVLIKDARNFLRGTHERFDVIIGDLVVPWRPGEGALYTLEQFTIARDRLARGGLYCAWLPMFQLSRNDFELILTTFRSVFSEVSVWRGDFSPNEPALALVGSQNAPLSSEVLARRLAEMRPDPSNPQLKHEAAFWMHLVGRYSGNPDGPFRPDQLNTANRPRVELRRGPLQPFVGRSLQAWEDELRASSANALKTNLSATAFRGWEAGRLMIEFTLLTREQKGREAAAVQQRLRSALGDEVSQSIFGP